jgi:hypothetical protein
VPLPGCGERSNDGMGEAGFEGNVGHSLTRSRFFYADTDL